MARFDEEKVAAQMHGRGSRLRIGAVAAAVAVAATLSVAPVLGGLGSIHAPSSRVGALNPQPLPPGADDAGVMLALNPQPIPPGVHD
jgi:hypothetical protein